jgi:hypothetical protein
VVGGFEPCRGFVGVAVCDVAVEPPVSESVDVAECCELDIVARPRFLRVHQLPLLEAVERSTLVLAKRDGRCFVAAYHYCAAS